MCRIGNTQLQNFFRRKPQKLVLAEIRAKKVCNFFIKQLALEFSRYRFQRIFTKPAKSADFDFLKLLGEVFIKQDFWRSSFLITVHTLRCSHLQYLIARYKIKHKSTIFLIYVFFKHFFVRGSIKRQSEEMVMKYLDHFLQYCRCKIFVITQGLVYTSSAKPTDETWNS